MNKAMTIQRFIDEYVNKIKSRTPVFTGALRDSISGVAQFNADNVKIIISSLEYGVYQDLGVNGSETNWGSPFTFNKLPNVSAFNGIANSLGISPWPIAISVFRKGIKPTYFMTRNLDDALDELGNEYVEAVWEELENKIN
jgi:hypothetical protein